MSTHPLTNETPDTCVAGHSLTEVNAAHAKLIEHVAGLTIEQVVGDLVCMSGPLYERLDGKLSQSDDVGLRTFLTLIQRLDAGAPVTDAIAPVEGAVTGSCSCADVTEQGNGTGTTGRINDVIDAMNAHAARHLADMAAEPTPGNYL